MPYHRAMRRTLATALVLTALTSTAMADGLLEASLGLAVPVGDDDYTDVLDESVKLGARFVRVSGVAGVEASLDYTYGNIDGDGQIGGLEFSAWRVRALIGGRYQRTVGRRGYAFARFGAGVDVAHLAAEGTLIVIPVDQAETDLGLAMELGGGVGVDVGPVALGLSLAVPVGLHFDGDDPADDSDFDFDYTSVDVDVLAFVGVRF